MKAYSSYKDSGTEWLGKIPELWETRKIKYLFRIQKRIAGQEGHQVLSITQEGIKVKDIESGEGQLAMDYSKYQFANIGDFAMNHMDLLTGYVDISKFNGVVSPDYRVFTLEDKDSSDKYYLYIFQLGYKNKIFFALGQGSSQLGRWRFPREEFCDFQLPYPSLPEQQTIAAFLEQKTSKIDKLVSIKKKQIELLKKKRASIINEVVTKGLNCNIKMKDSGIDWLDEIPEHWNVNKFNRIAFFQEGPGLRHWQFTSTGIKVICVTNIVPPKIDFSSYTKYISEKDYLDNYQHFTVRNGDLLLASSGASWGKVSTYQDNDVVILNTSTIRLNSISNELVDKNLIKWIIQSDYINAQLGLLLTGSCQPNFGPSHLKQLKCVYPANIKEQKAIADYLDAQTAKIEKSISDAENQIELLKEYRIALISEAVTGKIDVREKIS